MSQEDRPPTGPEIAHRAQEFKVLFLALALSLPSLLDPRIPVLQWELARAHVPQGGDLPFIVGHTPGDPHGLTFSVREVLTKMTTLRGDIVRYELLSSGMLLGDMRIGDLIFQGGHNSTSEPLLQFARHFRNACAHGDRWNFREREPKYTAKCRDFQLSSDLHGKRATFETISPRLYIEFLEDIINYFALGSAQDQRGRPITLTD